MSDRSARPLALAAADFDEDGVPDLVASFATRTGGFVTLHRGNVDSVYPNAPEAKARRAAGTFVDAPFLPEARSFDTGEPADFITAGDFDADGHQDVAVAAFGRGTVVLYAGDGAGGFARPEAIGLPGSVTTMTVGDLNRPDGLADLVVGVDGAAGAMALVFEGPEGALRGSPERFPLDGPALDLVVQRSGDTGWNDLVIAQPGGVVVVHGRDRRLSYPEEDRLVPAAAIDRFTLPFAIRAMAAGDFDGDRRTELALLDDGGDVHIAAPGELQAIGRGGGHTAEQVPFDMGSVPSRSPAGVREAGLFRVKVSSLPGDDLLLLRRAARRLDLRTPGKPADDGANAPQGDRRPSWIELDATASPVALLPMRLNRDALSDLVVLSEGASSLSTVETLPGMTFMVTNTNPSGPGSLEQAIVDADFNAGADTIAFDIPGPGPHVINDTYGLASVTDPVTIDATTEPDFSGSPIVVLDGTSAPVGEGLRVTGGSTTIAGMVISHYSTSAVTFADVAGDTLEGCFIGTDVTGTSSAGNETWGVFIARSPFTRIGGTTPAARNVISGSGFDGILIQELSPGVQIQGNYIGTDRDGEHPLKNNNSGVNLRNGTSATIGGTSAGSGNVISGNARGLFIGPGFPGAIVQGNRIGTNVLGNSALANERDGIELLSDANTIGGTTPAARNLISGNLDNGVLVGSSGTAVVSTVIQGNYIGTSVDGGNGLGNGIHGIQLWGSDNLIGGTSALARNVISGNSFDGISIAFPTDVGFRSTGNDILSNYIGTRATGSSTLGNTYVGVRVFGDGNRIGGSSSATANVISGNEAGVSLQGAGNLVEVNFIGTDPTGTLDLGNGDGIVLDAAVGGFIGVKIGQANVISGNTSCGIASRDSSARIQGNTIGLNATGTAALPNRGPGICVYGPNMDLVIGGAAAELGNTISGNLDEGLYLDRAVNIVIQNNRIGGAFPNHRDGILLRGGPLRTPSAVPPRTWGT